MANHEAVAQRQQSETHIYICVSQIRSSSYSRYSLCVLQIDDLLSTPQPYFSFIKKHYLHAVHKKSREGMYLYIERPGHGNAEKIFKNGLTLDDMEQHYFFVTEFLWRALSPSPTAQVITVFDVEVRHSNSE